jgi:phosphoribosylaminoimidazole-succinocarboxamide synthase
MIDHPFLADGPPPAPITRVALPGLDLMNRGKVRDMFDLGNRILMVATDRLSAFDVVMQEGFPGKGIVLTALSEFWFHRTNDIIGNHFVSTDLDTLDLPEPWGHNLYGRAMIVRKAKRIDIECVVRGYLSGSGWVDYQKTGACIGHALPAGLTESAKLPAPIFTPSTKAEAGHDENITVSQMAERVGADLTHRLEHASLRLYEAAAKYCEERGIILADTKFEFGMLDGELLLIDEALTPDSSRFWQADRYEPGKPQPSFDKQFVRDYLDSTGWKHEPPPPAIPPDIITKTMDKYREAYQRLVSPAR